MAKKDQQASWEHKRYQSPKKNEQPPVPEIQHGKGHRKEK